MNVQYTPEEIAGIRKAMSELYEKRKMGGGTPFIDAMDTGYLRAMNDVAALWIDLDLKKIVETTRAITKDIKDITAALNGGKGARAI